MRLNTDFIPAIKQQITTVKRSKELQPQAEWFTVCQLKKKGCTYVLSGLLKTVTCCELRSQWFVKTAIKINCAALHKSLLTKCPFERFIIHSK